MDEVVVIHVLSVKQVTVLPLAEVLWVNAVGPEELLVGDAERLTDGLSNQLGLRENKERTRLCEFSERALSALKN